MDDAQAAYWWRKAAEQGNADAQNNLGTAYSDGRGVPQDFSQAAVWWRKAADQGDANAQYNLGVAYDQGQGVVQDHAQAAYWYRKAAKQGIAEALGNLGAMRDKDRAEENSIIVASLSGLAILGAITGGIYDAFRRSGSKSFREWISPCREWISLFCRMIGILTVVIGIVVGGYFTYTFADNEGYISHTVETTITARSNWLVGESKDCWLAPNNYFAALAKKYGGVVVDKSGNVIDDSMAAYVMSSVDCDDGPQHKMKVVFYGRKFQDEYKIVTWRCTRNAVSFLNNTAFTCYQTGGQR